MAAEPAPTPAMEDRFVKMPYSVLCNPRLSHGARLTYALLLKYAWSDGRCFPAIDTLGDELGGVHRNTVRAYIGELRVQGLVATERRGKKKTNVYTLVGLDMALREEHGDAQPTVHHKEGDAQSTVHEDPAHAQPTVHHPDFHALPTVHHESDAQPTVHGDAQPTVHPYKEDVDTEDLDTLSSIGESKTPSPDAGDSAERARSIWADLRDGEPSDTEMRAMERMIAKWDDRAEATGVSLDEYALDAREWLTDKRRNKSGRLPSVDFFRNWVSKAVEESERRKAGRASIPQMQAPSLALVPTVPQRDPAPPAFREKITRMYANGERAAAAAPLSAGRC